MQTTEQRQQKVHFERWTFLCLVFTAFLLHIELSWCQPKLLNSNPLAPDWTVPMTISLSGDGNRNLAFGTKTGATDGLDVGVDLINPPPPPESYDTFFQISHPTFPNLREDYRSSTDTTHTWNLMITATGGANGSMTWDASNFPTGSYLPGTLHIKRGETVLADMLAVNSLNYAGDQNLIIE